MQCADVQKHAFTYLDGEFDPRERAEFDAHVAACQGCRGALEADAAMRRVLRRHLCVQRTEAPTRIRLQARLDACELAHASAARWPLALAALLLLGVGGWRMQQAVAGDSDDGDGETAMPSPTPPQHARGVAAAPQRPAAGQLAATLPLPAWSATTSPPAALAAQVAARGLLTGGAVAAEHDATLRQIAAEAAEAPDMPEVWGGAVDADFLTGPGPYGPVRSAANLRALVQLHASPLPPEVAGHCDAVRQWLADRLPGTPAPLVPEGAGVELRGARLGQLDGRPVVLYRYLAYGKAMTVVQHLGASRGPIEDPGVEAPQPGAPEAAAGALVDHLAGYQLLHALRDGQLVTVISELESRALAGLVAPVTFL